jgi:hypothetical protein
MGIEHYAKLCEKLRAKSQGDTAELDHSALYLDDCNISRFVDSLFHSLHPIPTLSLNLSRIGTSRRNGGSSWMPDGLDRLVQYIRISPSLVDVRLAGSEYCAAPTLLHSIVTHFLEAIENNPSIQRLALHIVSLEEETFARLIRRSRTLRHLSISKCSLHRRSVNFQRDDKIPSCHQKLAASFGLNKSIASLRFVEIGDDCLLPILEQLKSHRQIQKLDVSCDSATVANAIGQLVSGGAMTPPLLYHLVLRDSSLQGLESIVRHINHGSSTVQRLDVIHCSIDAVSASLFRTLFRCQKHAIQHVNFCDLILDDDTHLEEIFQGLNGSSTIRRLTLHRVPFQNRDLEALKQLLATNKTLTHVNLDQKTLATIENDISANQKPMKSPETKACVRFTFSTAPTTCTIGTTA